MTDFNQPVNPSQNSSRRVWFKLIDSSTGQIYPTTTVTSLHIESTADIDTFRKHMHSETSTLLRDILPMQLQVYENEASLKNNQEPLSPGTQIGSFGISDKSPIIIVVPVGRLSSFDSCEFPFFTNISNAEQTEGSVVFDDNIPSTSLKKLYVRECYLSIASSLMVGNLKAIITGTPGIGKSMFLVFLLWKLVKEHKRVLFIYHPYNIYYDGRGGVFCFRNGHLPPENDVSFWNDTLWCLFDAKFKNESDLGKFPHEFCRRFVVSTSPRREMLNDFRKPPEPGIFYMPTWTEAELGGVAPLFPFSSAAWRDRYMILGGIPRNVLEVTSESAMRMLEEACRGCSLDDCVKQIGLHSTITEKSKVVHRLVHIRSEPPFRESSVCYASAVALDMIIRNKGTEAKKKMRELLEACEGNPLIAAFCGHIFEAHAIEELEKGGKFTHRKLPHGNTKIQATETLLTIPPSTKQIAEKVEPDQTLGQLYVPKASNYAAIDAWIPGIGAFQMTVGKNHDIKSRVKNDLSNLSGSNRLYWLLPPLYYYSFTKKTPQDIDQYAVLIPYPAIA
jgi:hypothetical protein